MPSKFTAFGGRRCGKTEAARFRLDTLMDMRPGASIIMVDPATGPDMTATAECHVEMGKLVIDNITLEDASQNPAMLEKLSAIAAAEERKFTETLWAGFGVNGYAYGPVIDGEFSVPGLPRLTAPREKD